MKPIKTFGLTTLMALTTMAFAGVSSATAESTALCREDRSVCGGGATVTHVHAVTVAGTKATLLSAVKVECDGLFLGTAESGLASPLEVFGEVTYSNCTSGCTVTEENGPAEVKVLKSGHELASVTFKLLLHVVCSGFMNCRYSGEGLSGYFKGPLLSSAGNGEFTAEKQPVTRESGVLCPSKGEIDIVGTPLDALYITG